MKLNLYDLFDQKRTKRQADVLWGMKLNTARNDKKDENDGLPEGEKGSAKRS